MPFTIPEIIRALKIGEYKFPSYKVVALDFSIFPSPIRIKDLYILIELIKLKTTLISIKFAPDAFTPETMELSKQITSLLIKNKSIDNSQTLEEKTPPSPASDWS